MPETTYSYDFANHKTVVTDPVGNSTASNTTDGQTTYTYNEQLQVTHVVNAVGDETDSSYTPNGDVQTFGDAAGTANQRLTTLTYAPSPATTNNLTGGHTNGSASDQERFSINYCGDAGEASCGSDPLEQYRPTHFTGSNGQGQYFGYDSNGNLTDLKDASGTGSPAIQNRATLGYDPAGSDTAPRDGTLRSATDGNGNKTTFGYNTLRQLTSVNPPAAGTGGVVGSQLGATTSMTYDGFGRLKTYTDGKGQTHTFDYDPLDRLKKETLGSGEYISYTYDAAGNLTQRYESAGAKTSTYGYDRMNRRDSETFPGGQSDSYTYTLNSQVLTVADPGGTTTYGYDGIDRVTSITDPNNAAVTYAYSHGDASTPRNEVITLPGGVTQRTTYNVAGEPTVIEAKNGAGTVFTRRHYLYGWTDSTSASRSGAKVLGMEDQAGNVWTYQYDQTGQLRDATKVNAAGTSTDQRTWTFDKASNRVQLTHAVTGQATTNTYYKYNADNQLCWTSAASSTNACNATPSGGTGYTYDANGNQLNGDVALSYDSWDRTIGMAGTTLGYLSRAPNELTSYGSTSMFYNALGLAGETTGTAKTYIIRDPAGAPVAQRRYSGTTLQGTDYFLSDNLGSTIGLVTGGSLARTYDYDPDGNKTTSGSGASTDLLFAGGQQLPSGLIHYGARFYNPGLGRWTQEDPLSQIADLQQANRYGYVGGDPVNGADPTGLVSQETEDYLFDAGQSCFSGAAEGGAAAAVTGNVEAAPAAAGAGCAVGVVGTTAEYVTRKTLGDTAGDVVRDVNIAKGLSKGVDELEDLF